MFDPLVLAGVASWVVERANELVTDLLVAVVAALIRGVALAAALKLAVWLVAG